MYQLDPERAVLGGMMLSKRIIPDVLDVLDPNDFGDWKHETIARAVGSLFHRSAPTDVLAVTDELDRMGELARIGGPAVLHELTSEVPTAANAGYYADIVKQRSIKRRLLDASVSIAAAAQGEGDAFELAEQARATVDAVSGSARVEIAPVGDAVEDVLQSMRETPHTWPTPWTEINDITNGLRPGCMYVVGARPGSGKTMLGLQLAVSLTKYGHVAFASLEMSRADLTKRIFASKGTIHQTAISRSALSPDEWTRVERLRPEIAAMPLFIDDRPGLNMAQIRAFARSVQRRGPLVCLVVDYLQLITGDSRKPRWELVGEISRQLHELARELGIAVVALAQLNRESVGAGMQRRPPMVSDLRESGNIEQDADVIMLLQRGVEVDDNGEESPSDELEVYVGKNRHGNMGKLSLLWEGQFARLSNW